MQCDKVEQRLGAFLDGELSQEELQSVRTHLLKCGRCQQALRELQSVDAFLSDWDDEPLSPSLETRLSAIGRKSGAWPRFKRTAALAASVAVAFYLGVVFSADISTEQTSQYDTLAFEQQSLYEMYAEVGQ